MVLVDTSVWVDYFNGLETPRTDRLDQLLGSGRLLTGDLILAELLRGFAKDADYRTARRLLLELPCAELVGRDNALRAADYCRRLRKRGVMVRKTIDVFIGTYCIQHGHELLHADRDLDPMQRHLGLRIPQ